MRNMNINFVKTIKIKNSSLLLIFFIINFLFCAPVLKSQNAYFEKGLEYSYNEKFDSSIIYYSLSIESDSACSEAFYERAYSYAYSKSMEIALTDIDEYIIRCPEMAKGKVLRGIIYKSLLRYEEAIENFKTGIDSGYTFLYPDLGYCYYIMGNIDLSLAALDSAIYYKKDLDKSYYLKGICLLDKENTDSACVYLGYSTEYGNYEAESEMCLYCDSLQVNKAKSRSYIADGLNYAYAKNYDPAIVKFLISIELASDNPDAYYYIGRCFYYKKNYDSAVKYFTKAIMLDQEKYYYSYRAISYYNLMQDRQKMLSKSNRYLFRNYAIKDFEKYISMDTTYYYGYSYLAWIYFYDNYDVNKSIRFFNKALELNKGDIDVMVGLLLSYYSSGDEEMTRKYYKEICEIVPKFMGNKKGLEFLEGKFGYNYTEFEKSVFAEMFGDMFKDTEPFPNQMKAIPVKK